MSRLRLLLIAAALLAVATPADASAYDVRGTPKLYAVSAPDRLGQPVAYVVFRGTSRLHRIRDARVRVHGHSGRSYSWPGACVRSAFVNSADDGSGEPVPLLKGGSRYRVTITYRGDTVWTGRLTARRLARGATPPRC